MPAHEKKEHIGSLRLGNGGLLSKQDVYGNVAADQLAKDAPGLVPRNCDVKGCHQKETAVGDCSAAAISALGKSRKAHREIPSWCRKFKPYLTSAVSGGQWPQARKASVKAWGITDSSCQLCHKEKGTIEHRLECEKIRPKEGWPEAPESKN